MRRIKLSERDIEFVVEAATPASRSKTDLKKLVLEDESFRKSLTEDEKVFDRLMNQKGILKEISPALFFEVLLRRAFKEIQKATYTLERTAAQKIPVFDALDAMELMKNEDFLYYLVDLLDSFVVEERNTPKDSNLDSLIRMGVDAEDPERFLIHKRIGDVCLLILGIFPEYLTQDYYYLFFNKKPPILGEERRGVADYEFLGQEFYYLAAKESRGRFLHLRDILQLLSENFYLAKKPLNFISEKYLKISAS